jgi:N-ethylmaleimide reductase
MNQPKLFTPIRVGAIDLANRIVMAPLTRNRARHDGDVPHALNVEYYRQRASAGLLITEATQISPEGKGYAYTPGIYSAEQIAGWKAVTDAVHAEGGKIVLQMWNVGRVSHTSLQPNGQAPVAPSAIAAGGKTFDGTGFVDTSLPRALETEEIARVVADYAKATRNAREAGFDGVEIHGANGYLIDQFLNDGSNHRTDAYGGPVENRTRLLSEVIDAVVGAWDKDHVGIRLSPFANANGVHDSDSMAVYGAAVDIIDRAGLAYLHVVEGKTGGPRDAAAPADLAALRDRFHGPWIGNNGYTRELAVENVESGKVDLVAFGKLYIANPDLVARLAADAPLNAPDQATFYGGGAEGYTDYPTLTAAAA